jgi:hypothetical protein
LSYSTHVITSLFGLTSLFSSSLATHFSFTLDQRTK